MNPLKVNSTKRGKVSSYSRGNESFAKKLARAFIWSRIKELLGTKVNALVLAGPKAGDILTAEASGFKRVRFTALDRDRRCIERAGSIVPGARLIHADLLSFAQTCTETFRVIWLDFCQQVTPESAGTFTECVNRLSKPGSLVGFAFSYGRESRDNALCIEHMPGPTAWEKRFQWACKLINAGLIGRHLKYVQLVRYLAHCPGDKSLSKMFGALAVVKTTPVRTQNKVPRMIFDHDADFRATLRELVNRRQTDFASKLFQVQKEVIRSIARSYGSR